MNLTFPAFVKNSLNVGDSSTYKYVDMFCGIGGFHLAAESYGMKCVFACDVDAEARKAYEHNFGLRPAGDITGIEAERVPNHDFFFAGFPCQPFSIIGHRKGFDDIRGTLFFEIARILRVKLPPAIVLENVKQLVGHDKGSTIARIMEVLREIGYTADYKVLNALDYGLPQKRERVIIVGLLEGFENFEWPLGERPMKPLTEILEEDPDKKYFVSDRIKRRRHKLHKSEFKPAIWHENKSGNVSSYPYSCALRAGASYNYLLVDGERRLTPREMLRLQGFPNSFEIVCNDSQTRKQAGNAVPAPMVADVLGEVIHAVKEAKIKGETEKQIVAT